MTLADLLAELDKLERIEKLRVIQHLAQSLESGQENVTEPIEGRMYEVWSPQDHGGAVATLHKLLQEHKLAKNAE